tara:strand:+ start:645 stop:836 length:192 start_codon:yes stop_codon:yes gene_type:complete
MDKIDFMKLFLKMGSIGIQTKEEALAFQERIVFSTEGVIRPNDWDKLQFEERQKRMNQLLKQI